MSYLDKFKNYSYEQQLEMLSLLWRSENLDEYYECLNVFKKEHQSQVEADLEKKVNFANIKNGAKVDTIIDAVTNM